MFFRFAGIFGLFALTCVAAVVIPFFLPPSTLFVSDMDGMMRGRMLGVSLRLIGCWFSLLLPLIGFAIAAWGFRNIARPLSDMVDASEAVAKGDLSVRIEENAPGGFGHLASTFNRMLGELERIDTQRKNLTADIAHELRTPLHIIQGNLEAILDGVHQPTTEHISATLEETRLLARLVEDLRLLSLAESGQLVLKKQSISIADLLADAATAFGPQAESQGVILSTDNPAGDLMIQADPDRLAQVLNNLVSNALRHTSSGGSIRLRAEKSDGGVILSVSDTGTGIAPEHLPYVFDRFWKADPARGHGSGSGLGLAIARHLVTLHGGTISAESGVGKGTVFTIRLAG
jgi:signal transduction histidine kinase